MSWEVIGVFIESNGLQFLPSRNLGNANVFVFNSLYSNVYYANDELFLARPY